MFGDWKDPVTGKMYKRGGDRKLRDKFGKIPKPKKIQSEWPEEAERQNDLGLFYNKKGQSQYEVRFSMLQKLKPISLDGAINYDLYCSWLYLKLKGRWKEWYRLLLRKRSKKKYKSMMKRIQSNYKSYE